MLFRRLMIQWSSGTVSLCPTDISAFLVQKLKQNRHFAWIFQLCPVDVTDHTIGSRNKNFSCLSQIKVARPRQF